MNFNGCFPTLDNPEQNLSFDDIGDFTADDLTDYALSPSYSGQHFVGISHANTDNSVLQDESNSGTNIITKPVQDPFLNLGLSDNRLLNIGTRDLNKLLRDNPQLKPAEIKGIKHRRRVLKNCKSARSSRKKKNDKVKCLEDELRNRQQLSQKIIDLRTKIHEQDELIRTLISWIASLYMQPTLR